jgi:enoyl-CoA hydratase/carnithine racemase
MNQRVVVEIEQGIADVRLARADKMNAFDDPMFTQLIEQGLRLKVMSGLRAVVISGEGKAFCAGIDLNVLEGFGDGAIAGAKDLARRTHGVANRFQYAVWVWREIPVPVIAAVHGVAFGAGLQLALAADMRYLGPETRMAVMEVKWGLVPDMCGTQLMRHLVREDIVRELTYTGRIFSAQEALDYGFATRLCPDPKQAAMAVAREIALRSPDAVRAAKRLLADADTLDHRSGLLAEALEQQKLIGGRNQRETVLAAMAKREPAFADPEANAG